MSNKPLVSIIMSEYNTDTKLLKESIKSILEQTYNNFEFIIIDDCGKNNVKKIVKEFNDERIKVYKNNKNSGLVFSLNKALKLSKGKYIARMDTDDYSYKDRIKREVDFLEKNNEYDVVGANANYYDGKEIWGRSHYNGEVTKKQILNYSPLIHPSVMLKKEIILKCGGYPNYNRCEDYALWIKLFSKGYKLYNIEKALIRYHLSVEDYKKRTLKTRLGFFKLLNKDYKKLNPSLFQLTKIYLKTLVAGVIPKKII